MTPHPFIMNPHQWIGRSACPRQHFVTLRNEATKNFRYRKAEKEKERRDRAKSHGHTASAKAATAAVWASSASGAYGCPEENDAFPVQPLEWRWSDYFMVIFLWGYDHLHSDSRSSFPALATQSCRYVPVLRFQKGS